MNPWILDVHCDTISKLLNINGSLLENKCHIDLYRMKKYELNVQCFAAWIEPRYYQNGAIKQTLKIIKKFYDEIEKNKEDIAVARNYDEIIKNRQDGKISAILTIEGGEALEGDLSMVYIYYVLGVRMMTLTWNHRNQIADGVLEDKSKGGISSFGIKVIEEMNRLGMVIDVSHINEKGFWDVLKYSNVPVMASHSNAKRICNHPRNLTDEQLKALAETNGMVGINFYPDFLCENKKASIEDVINHIGYIKNLIGIDYIGLGADYDGIEKTPQNMEDIKGYNVLYKALVQEGYTNIEIEKIFHLNFMNFIKRIMK